MALRSSYWINRAAILMIRGYQKILSGKINRDCIYAESCSHFAIRELRKQQNTIDALRTSLRRYRGCGISQIDIKSGVIRLRNLHGNVLAWESLDHRTKASLAQQLAIHVGGRTTIDPLGKENSAVECVLSQQPIAPSC